MHKNKKIINKICMICIFLIIMVFFSLKINNYSLVDTNDGYIHVIRVVGVSEIIKTKQFPPAIFYGFCNGYGINIFYNPLTTYISLLFGFIANNYVLGIKLMLIMMIILAFGFMYVFLKKVTKKELIAFLGSIFFITNTYYFTNIFVRGAIAEVAALTFLPILFLGLYILVEEEDKRKQFFIIIGVTGLILTHNITALYAAFFSLIYLLINIKKINNDKIVKYLEIDFVFIIILTIFFIYPLVLHEVSGDYAIFNSSLMQTNNASVIEQVLPIKNLFINSNSELIFAFNIVQLLLLLPSIFLMKKVDESYKNIYKFFLVLIFVLIFCVVFPFIWKVLPGVFCNIQFPWRLLGFVQFFTAFVAGVNFNILLNKNEKIGFLSSIIVAILSFLFVYLMPYKMVIDTHYNDNESVKNIYEGINKISFDNINKEYLPVSTCEMFFNNQDTFNVDSASVISGECNIINQYKDKLKYTIEFTNLKKDTKIEIPFLHYVGYKAYIEEGNNKEYFKIEESECGFLQVDCTKDCEEGRMIVEYKTPFSYYIVYGISFIGLIAFIIYIFLCVKKKEE